MSGAYHGAVRYVEQIVVTVWVASGCHGSCLGMSISGGLIFILVPSRVVFVLILLG